MKLTSDKPADEVEVLPATGPSIAELAKAARMVPGGDTAAASKVILARLAEMMEAS